MSSTSVQASSSSWRQKYEVFLSFRGKDTGNGFTADLFSALEHRGIFTFKDDERTPKSNPLLLDLFNATAQSRIFIVVFSKNYADSTWCLDQLAKISERTSRAGYTVLPIFYHVEPSEVRHQKGNFEVAFHKHEQDLSESMEMVKRWRRALTEVANRYDCVLRPNESGSEAAFIDKIVNETVSILKHRGRSRRTWKYEVFLSFRGEDTRHGFTSHLFSALQRKGIFPFKDDTGIHKGDSISRELLNAIEQSRISIVVFSKHYADSTWCLEELAKISEAIFKPGYTVMPVFYDVDPSEVQNQSGNFKQAFDKHEQNFSDNMEKVQRWRIALTQVSNLSGWDVRTKSESEVIGNIVNETISELGHKFSSLADDLVGIQSRVEVFENLLNLESDEVRFVGIWGMAGIGKTTLATVVYDKISCQFDAACFLSDASGVSRTFGIVHLQQQFLSQILLGNLKVEDSYEGRQCIKHWLSQRKTLIVVDNVDSRQQLENLVGGSEWFGAGSRIIITTRDEHLLRAHRVEEVFKFELLKDDEALQLFCRKAFKRDDPLSDFQELTHNLLEYAQALPLAITALGSSLFMRQKSEWSTELERLKKNPNEDVMKVLRTTYWSLYFEDKEVFLDIACFFKGADMNYVKKILRYCRGISPDYSITILRGKSLIGIVNGTLWMHDLLQELGRKIVQEESPIEPARRSRLWSYKDLQVVNVNKGMDCDVKAIVLNDEVPEETLLNAEVLSQMKKLRLLILPDVKFSGNLSDLSNRLKFLSWQKFPFSCLPSSFKPYGLVELIMPDSNIRQLWEGKKFLKHLRSIDLGGSKNLVETPDLSRAPNLERLSLEGCTGLLQVHPSIGCLGKLLFFNLRKCTHLNSIPNNIFLLSSLQYLNLSHCSRLRKISHV